MNSRLQFSDLSLSKEIAKAIETMGFEEPTPIQALAIPLIQAGRDVTAQAQTGTGKTSAFGIPVIENIDASQRVVQAIVLCPTRELAIQIAEEFSQLSPTSQKFPSSRSMAANLSNASLRPSHTGSTS